MIEIIRVEMEPASMVSRNKTRPVEEGWDSHQVVRLRGDLNWRKKN
jgi:hypothetical protein